MGSAAQNLRRHRPFERRDRLKRHSLQASLDSRGAKNRNQRLPDAYLLTFNLIRGAKFVFHGYKFILSDIGRAPKERAVYHPKARFMPSRWLLGYFIIVSYIYGHVKADSGVNVCLCMDCSVAYIE